MSRVARVIIRNIESCSHGSSAVVTRTTEISDADDHGAGEREVSASQMYISRGREDAEHLD